MATQGPMAKALKQLRERLAQAEEEQTALAPRNRRHWVAVCYDIPDDRRRTKVMKTLEGFGQRVR